MATRGYSNPFSLPIQEGTLMKQYWKLLAGLLLGLIIGSLISFPSKTQTSESSHLQEASFWTCSMHPHIHQDEAGSCPVCGMDLIPVVEESLSVSGKSSPEIFPEVETSPLIKGVPIGFKKVNGIVQWDQTKIKTESAWFAGRLDQFKVKYPGQTIRKGQLIAQVYSPKLLETLEEWNLAKQSTDSVWMKLIGQKFERLGVDPSEYELLKANDSQWINLRAKHSGVVLTLNVTEGEYVSSRQKLYTLGSNNQLWIEFQVYPSELPFIHLNQEVQYTLEGLGAEVFKGRINFIAPELDPQTRTIPVRIKMTHYHKQMKPGMLVLGKLQLKSNNGGLYIPQSAPLFMGTEALVYVEEGPGLFSPRRVQLGEKIGDYYQVLSGLDESAVVVSRGAFKIDAARQIQGSPSMMNGALDE